MAAKKSTAPSVKLYTLVTIDADDETINDVMNEPCFVRDAITYEDGLYDTKAEAEEASREKLQTQLDNDNVPERGYWVVELTAVGVSKVTAKTEIKVQKV